MSDQTQLHRTSIIAEHILKIFEKEKLDMAEGYMVIAMLLRSIGLIMNFGPKRTLSILQRVLIRLSQLSKTREKNDRLWVPKGIGVD